MSCALCTTEGGQLVWRGEKLRVIRADEAGFPAFYRVVWNAHVAEFSDLAPGDRQRCMDVVTLIEQVLREKLAPTKINLATLGNVVPHLHWHVIARFDWDSHFPAPVWTGAVRVRDAGREAAVAAQCPAIDAELHRRLSA
ncbi:HIT family protein [Comamonas faecalis]|uniref:HIT family protein n=1 Tax=Comamonas faecalis TaxID=1387849 RepID=A0ABP7QY08_9BURK